MSLPLLKYAPSSQNQRVAGFEVGTDEQPKIYNTENMLSPLEMDDLIWAAYRQMFFHAFKSDRQVVLESQLRNGQITVRDFIRGLALSETYRSSFYDKNSNYRFVEQTVQRILGRDPYSEQEKIAWSIVVATKGITGFVDALLDSEEYIDAFGYNTVPYQRRRNLPSRAAGEIPFNIKSPRYDAYHRAQLGFPQIIWQNAVRRFVPSDRAAKAGDPANFLGMARGINPQANPSPRVSALNMDFNALVPRR